MLKSKLSKIELRSYSNCPHYKVTAYGMNSVINDNCRDKTLATLFLQPVRK